MSDERKIQLIFENTNTCIKRGDSVQYPILKRKTEGSGYVSYLYSVPLGIDERDIEKILSYKRRTQ